MLWLDLGEYRGPGHFHAFMMFSLARLRQRVTERSYRLYVTESLRYIPQGMHFASPWTDAIRSHEDIDVDDIIAKVAAAVDPEET